VSGQNETKYYYHFDGLGSVVALTADNGAISERYHYNVFGQPNAVSTIGNRFMFTGREYESETGLYHYRARAYNPVIGRFLQPDPIHYKDGLNLYSYVKNRVVVRADPYGLMDRQGFCTVICGGVTAVIYDACVLRTGNSFCCGSLAAAAGLACYNACMYDPPPGDPWNPVDPTDPSPKPWQPPMGGPIP